MLRIAVFALLISCVGMLWGCANQEDEAFEMVTKERVETAWELVSFNFGEYCY